jgi:hypothetical protein
MSDGVRGLIVGGVVAIVVAVLWRYAVLHGRRSRALRGLDALDPQDRARAAIALIDEGLQRSAEPILARLASEQDDRVRLAIAPAVARRTREPVDTKQVTQLHHWASLELERQGRPVHTVDPAVTRLSDTGGSPPPEQDVTVAPSTAPPTSEPHPEPSPKPGGVDWHAPSERET